MKKNTTLVMACFLAGTSLSFTPLLSAAPKSAPLASLNDAGNTLEKKYAAQLSALRAEFVKILPKVDAQQNAAFQKTHDDVKAAEAEANAAAADMGKIQGAKGLVDHAKGKWIGGAEKGIAAANAALKKATTDAERAAAQKDLAHWQANKADGEKELVIRQAGLDKAKLDEPKLTKANEAAKAKLAQAKAAELSASKSMMGKVETFLANDKLDSKLVVAAVLAQATPRGLAEYAQQGSEQAALVDKLLADQALMSAMLEAGGAKFGQYGKAMEIFTAIRKVMSQPADASLQRLALAVSLEHAKPIEQSNAADQKNAPATVDPVKRYSHYEKAFLAGELDPAFKTFTTWEYRMVVDCDAPDEILAWGREMLRNYRPDHIYNPDYGWRYSSTIRTEVPYGSQNVVNDLPSSQQYQNIIMNGGVCGRRAFFGRFILQSFGIPTWGVTQKAHAALSHWTPKGWVINLGAGFEHSWWDKDEAPRSGNDFLLESQARAHGKDFVRVQRAQWISVLLGEEAYNERKGVTGGFWSGMAHDQSVALASTSVALGPLGQELAEANESKEKQRGNQAKLSDEDRKVVIGKDGSITIPAVANSKATGSSSAMKSFAGGFQLHCTGGYKAEYEFTAPRAGKYSLSARVVTTQTGQKILVAANQPTAPSEITVPYTLGKWELTKPIELTLTSGKNTLHFALADGSRGVSIKDLILTPIK